MTDLNASRSERFSAQREPSRRTASKATRELRVVIETAEMQETRADPSISGTKI